MTIKVNSKSIKSIDLYKKKKHWLLHLNIIPFVILYIYVIYLYAVTPVPIDITTINNGTIPDSTGTTTDKNYTEPTTTTTPESTTTTTELGGEERERTQVFENDYEFINFIFAFGVCLHIVSELFKHWSVDYKCFVSLIKVDQVSQADYAKVTPTSHVGSKQLSAIVHVIDQHTKEDKSHFEFQKRTFTYDSEKKQFTRIKLKVPTESQDICNLRGYETEQSLTLARERYGTNRFDIPIPAFLTLYKEQALAPFFVFQVFCVLLWSLEEYVYYCMFTLFMLLTFEATVVKSRLRNLQSLKDMSSKPSYPIYVYRLKNWIKVDTTEIIPGDIVSISRGTTEATSTVPCDLLLLSGGCVVNEAMLTGESTPHHKESMLERSSKSPLDLKNDKIHIIYGGTQIVQQNSEKFFKIPKAPDNGCITYAIKTGFDTNQGRLMRTIWFSSERVTANNKESFLFILFLLMFAIAASIYLFLRGMEDEERSKYKLILHCIMVITSVVPPELPMELSLAVNNSLMSLVRLGIYCTEPFRIPFAGKVDVCCFDKTGTLTTDDLILLGIASGPKLKGGNSSADDIDEDEDEKEKESKSSKITQKKSTTTTTTPTITKPTIEVEEKYKLELPNTLDPIVSQLLAGCHSLVLMQDGKLIGDPMETASFKSIPYNCKGDNSSHQKQKIVVEVVNRYHFSSELKRMSTLANVIGNSTVLTYGFVKGAPEVLKPMFRVTPEDYDDVYKYYSRQGSRVLSLGYKKMDNAPNYALKTVSREQVECNLEFAGFLVFDCPLKPDSMDAITKLSESSHQIVMITGDNSLTACHVAKQLGIMKNEKKTLILQTNNKWVSVDETIEIDFQPTQANHLIDLDKQYNLAMSGSVLSMVNENQLLRSTLYLVTVFARVSPEQKQLILANFKEGGHHTLMAGDGTNDVGALKQAHVGIAILNKGDIAPRGPPPSLSQLMARRPPPQPGMTQRQQIEEMTKRLQEEMKEQEVQMVKLGDASIAAPFTSRSSRVIPVTHIIRQGRCTLVTTFQMYKILALNSLISAYSLSVLYLDGVKLGDTQVTIAGMLIAMCFLFISTSKPLDKLANRRPNPNLFSPYMILSILLQFALHLSCLIFIVGEADRRREGERPKVDSTFVPNLVNSAVFLISNAMQVATFAVNYKGHPFMQSLRENRPLLYCLSGVWLLGVVLSLEISPEWNQYLELIPFPDSHFRYLMFGTIVVDLVGAWLIEKICSVLFKS